MSPSEVTSSGPRFSIRPMPADSSCGAWDPGHVADRTSAKHGWTRPRPRRTSRLPANSSPVIPQLVFRPPARGEFGSRAPGHSSVENYGKPSRLMTPGVIHDGCFHALLPERSARSSSPLPFASMPWPTILHRSAGRRARAGEWRIQSYRTYEFGRPRLPERQVAIVGADLTASRTRSSGLGSPPSRPGAKGTLLPARTPAVGRGAPELVISPPSSGTRR